MSNIREGMANKYCLWAHHSTLKRLGYDKSTDVRWQCGEIQDSFEFVDQIISYLKGQNVVRLKSGSEWYPIWSELALNKAQANWLRENFRAVEELK